MKFVRIIPRLDIKGPNLVKGVHLEGLRVLGKPEDFAKIYYQQGADELIYQDTVASLYQRNNLTEIISKTAENIFIPITVGGGIRSIEDINKVLRSGADKVSINTAAIKNPDFVNEASKNFGSSTIVIAVEVIKESNNRYFAYTDNGREYTGIDAFSWIKEVQLRGAGEILLTSIDKDGTGEGFDLNLINSVSKITNIPLIVHGSPSKPSHITELMKQTNVSGIALASMLHYPTALNAPKLFNNYDDEGNIDFLMKSNSNKKFGNRNLMELKKNINNQNFSIRID